MAISERYVTSAGSGTADGLTEANSWSWATMLTTASAGHRCNVKGAVSRTTSVDVLTNSGTVTSPIIIRGYSSSITDGYQGRTNDNGALITTNMPLITYTTGRFNVTGTFILFECLQITSAASFGSILPAADSVVTRCVLTNSSTNAGANGMTISGARTIAFNCDASLTGASGGNACIVAGQSGAIVDSCRCQVVTSATANCIVASNVSVIHGNLCFHTSSNGIFCSSTTGSPFIRDNTIVRCNEGIVFVSGTTVLQRVIGNMITDHFNGIDFVNTSNGAFIANNRTRGNSNSAYVNGGDWVTATQYEDVTTGSGTSSDYSDYAGDDFNIIFSSAATNAGTPKFATIGALQPEAIENLGGSGGGGFFVQ